LRIFCSSPIFELAVINRRKMTIKESNNIVLLAEIFTFLAIIILDAVGILPITQTIYMFPLIWLALRLQKTNFKSIGLEIGKFKIWKSFLIGILLGLLIEIFATFITTPILSELFGAEPNLSAFKAIRGNLNLLLFFILISWIIAAFGEEICFRGFLMNRLATLFGNTKNSWIASLILSSIIFGFGHTEQGITGWIQEGLNGLFLGIMFLAFGRNLIIPIIAHGISNTFAFIMIYFGLYPGT